MVAEFSRLNEQLTGTGLFVRGGFHPDPDDEVPPLPDGTPARTVILIGNAGNDLWRAFRADRPVLEGDHPLDEWLEPILERTADAAGAHLVLPNKGRPYPPVQRWARRAEPVHQSPIGLMIHPDYGLWHVYRAALLFADRLDLPPRADAPSPCDTCADKPCLTVCPADAFRPGAFDAAACVTHVESPRGTNCAERGCLARRACPAGRAHSYEPGPGAFHMAAVARAVRRMIARGEVAVGRPIKPGGRSKGAPASE